MLCLGTIARHTATALFAVACLGFTTTAAFADTYDVYIAGPQGGYIYAQGINSSGQALIYDGKGFDSPTYYISDHGKIVSTTHAVPSTFIPDNGSACPITYQGFTYQGVCNNGYEAFGQHYIEMPIPEGLYVGHDGIFTSLDLMSYAFVTLPDLYLNSSGDVAFLDEFSDTNYQAYNTTTPEPSSYLLLLTGVGLVFAAHRRLLS